MRIAELSRRSGLTAATIKYYLREGLLPPGVHLHPNQVEYAEHHLTRLRLIRALIDVGGLSVNATSDLLDVLDSPDLDAWESVGKAQYAISSRPGRTSGEPDAAAEEIVVGLLERRGWRVRADSPARKLLIEQCATLHALGHDDIVGALDRYAAAVEKVVAVDISLISQKSEQDEIASIIEKVIVATVFGDAVLSALRQLAQEHTSRALLTKAPTTARRSRQPRRSAEGAKRA